MIVGIVGAGQLARMLALSGIASGQRFVFLDPAPDACAAPLGDHLCGAYDDPALLDRLAERTDAVTFEFENVPENSIEFLSGKVAAYPGVRALATARDRLREKTLFLELGIPTPAFAAVDSLKQLRRAVRDIRLPAVLKTCTLGYDGKGQYLLRKNGDLERAWERLGGVPLVLESFVNFDREVSIIAVRSRNGETAFYPLSENVHRDGILRTARSRPGDPFEQQARSYAERLLHELDYVGVMALELFQTGDKLLANEMAPRVHNTGHWTIEGAETSQFENHLRAILGLPLGGTAATGHSAMINLISELPDPAGILALPGTHLHCYAKMPRPGRKLGHVTVLAHNEHVLQVGIDQLSLLIE
ncbi:MAG: 5-(carboxyamino)imidazole ribonucleotide synthase [Sedimenticola sp.]|nr:5-(carboxyamino)imidazole ribonucleotide synthase [Sedimenticola sp.]